MKENNLDIVCKDIQYREGILEYLEINSNIKYIIINEKIPGNIKIEDLILNIKQINKNIKIILISENKELNEKNKINVYRIYEKINIKEIIKLANDENIFNKKTIPMNNLINKECKDAEIITILGPNGIGKSVFSIIFANNIKNKNILMIDFDVLNNNLHNLLGVKEYSKIIKEKIQKNNLNSKNKITINNNDFIEFNIEDFIIKTKFNIDLISGISLIFDSKYQISPIRIRNLIKKIKNKYDLIIIDTSSECFFDYTKELIKIANKSIFISGANLLEIKKSEKLLEIYNKEWSVEREKIQIIFNKCTKQSIDDSVLKEIFHQYKILGKIKLSDYYDLVINNNISKRKEIQKEIEKIKKNMESQKNVKTKLRSK